MRTWLKKKKPIVIFVVLMAIVAFVAYAVSLFNRAKQTGIVTRFNCLSPQSNETFVIDVEVDIADGLDRNEAVEVATALWKEFYVRNTPDRITSFTSYASSSENGVWTVKFAWARIGTAWYPGTHVPTTRIIHESFQAIIDPLNRTVTYGS